ncbi:hypothetical protein DXA14_15395 [Hungatella hathewayi]|nr:hypothetical protein DXA14_15395 [Hungatella hathewayi]RHB65529.1 hypothetical protein DW876_24025 [Hungatella hathewayi]
MPLRIWREYRKWHENWDELCSQCGLCCYTRSVTRRGEVRINFASPCEFLDEKTHLCRVYESRFRRCPTCQKVNLFRALFHPSLPPECAYGKTFRLWK